ncbi:MAG: acyltransferase family protein [Synechococcaceae cyanobacterium]|nr:acyltransferase family protein [Synechococcaceae cyanobacterium]
MPSPPGPRPSVPPDGAATPGAPGSAHVYRPEIDGLRAIAVLAVIVNHIDPLWLPSGHLGVDIFFVISGCVITGSLARQPGRELGDLLSGFYARRLRRLVPALLLMVVPTALLICLVDPHPHGALRTGLMALVGLSNLELLQQATDYFARAAQLNPFTHTWSLGVEEQFYLLFPLLVWSCGLGRRPQGRRRLALAMTLLSLASLIGFVVLWQRAPASAYFLMPTRLWELGAGCLLQLALEGRGRLEQWLGRLPPLPLAVALLASLTLPRSQGLLAHVACVLLTALLLGSLRRGQGLQRLLSHPRLVYIGLLSYSLYLWHWVVLCLGRWTIGLRPATLAPLLLLMLLLAVASYELVETPLRRARWHRRRRGTVALGMGALGLGSLVVLGLDQLPPYSLFSGRRPQLQAEGVKSLSAPYRIPGTPWRWAGEACVLGDNSQIGKRLPLRACTLGDPLQASRRVLVLGNSFSASVVAGFDRLVREDGFAVTLTSSWAASPVPEISNLGPYAPINAHYWNREVPALIAGLRSGDWVFLVSDMMIFSPPLKDRGPGHDQALQQLQQGLIRLSDRLGQRGIRLAVLHGNPFAREAECHPASAIPQWFAPGGGPCRLPDRTTSLQRRLPLDRVLQGLEQQGRLRVIDLFDLFCPGPQCTYNASDGTVLYRDEHSHPSIEAMRLAAPTIRERLLDDRPAAAGRRR